jgi:hypothetical protein
LTVRRKESEACVVPSLTKTVIVVVPDLPVVGVRVRVRLAPLPPNAKPPDGTSCESEEIPEKVRLLRLVSLSPTVKFTSRGVFSFVV